MVTDFDEVISRKLGDNTKVSGKYTIPECGGKIIIEKEDLGKFSALFYEKGDRNGIGHGEVSLYWLFNYSEEWEVQKLHSSDLFMIGKDSNEITVEVKSWDNPNGLISIGYWGKDKFSRRIVNYAFSYSNIFGIQDREYRFKTEYYFRASDLIESFTEIFNNEAIDDPIFVERILSVLEDLKTLNNGVEVTDPKLAAYLVMKNIILTKLRDKPGEGGYICNIRKIHETEFDLSVFKISLDNLVMDHDEFFKSVMIDSGTLKINISKVFNL